MVDLKLSIDTLALTFMCAVVEDDVEHTILTDQYKICIHEMKQKRMNHIVFGNVHHLKNTLADVSTMNTILQQTTTRSRANLT
jgi:hypothetical protein